MRKLTTIFAGSAVFLLALATAAGAGGIMNLGAMTVDPDSGPAGTTFTVSGDDCGYIPSRATDKQALDSWFVVNLWFEAGDQTATAPAGGEGMSWSHDFTVPDGTPAGDYMITAECVYNNYDGAQKVAVEIPVQLYGRYDDGTFTVTEPATTTTTTTPPVTAAATTTTTAAPTTTTTTPPVTAAAASELPRTGADVGLLSAGGGMLLAGSAALVGSRRRNRR